MRCQRRRSRTAGDAAGIVEFEHDPVTEPVLPDIEVTNDQATAR